MRFFCRGKKKSHALFSLQVLELDSNAYDFTDALNLFSGSRQCYSRSEGFERSERNFQSNPWQQALEMGTEAVDGDILLRQ